MSNGIDFICLLGPVVQPGVHVGLSSRRSRVQIPSGPPALWFDLVE